METKKEHPHKEIAILQMMTTMTTDGLLGFPRANLPHPSKIETTYLII